MSTIQKTAIAIGFVITIASSSTKAFGQQKILSDVPPAVEYQYQLHYPRVWGWPGPGLSLGGTIPGRGREGISSYYGTPLPVPLGAGAYMNPFAYSARLPGPMSFGLSSTNSAGVPQSELPDAAPGVPGAAINRPTTNPNLMPTVVPAAQPVIRSKPEMIGRSMEMEFWGDGNIRQQNWTQAYINYRNAVLTADDRAEPHVRLGMTCVVLQKYPEAAQEFKRALQLDPEAGRNANEIIRELETHPETTIQQLVLNVAKWAKQDLKDQDHLFLLGIMMHFNQDPRSKEILEACLRLPGPQDHLMALMSAPTRAVELQAPELETPIPPSPSSELLPPLQANPIAVN